MTQFVSDVMTQAQNVIQSVLPLKSKRKLAAPSISSILKRTKEIFMMQLGELPPHEVNESLSNYKVNKV